MRRATSNPVTLPFGATTSPYSPSNPHTGTDFAYNPDHTVYAPEAGAVQVSYDGTNGNMVRIVVDNRIHALLHNAQVLVSNGQAVSEGQPVAIMGDTGYAFGKHLHWALKIGGRFVDPLTQVKEEEVITDNDKDYLRILHSEAGGWDLQKTHAGEYDGIFLDTYRGKDIREVIGNQWKNGGPWRDYRSKAIAFYEQYKDKIDKLTTEDDEPQIKEALAKLAEAEAKAKEAQAKHTEAIND